MIILKQVIHDAPTNSVEATWVERTTTPEVIVPESVAPDTVDADGNVILGAVTPQHIIPAVDTDVQVRCHSYSDRQMDMLRADLGADAADYEDLIALVESNIQPIPPPTAEQLRANAKAARTTAVAAITVTTSTGKTFDGDEQSQERMARAILISQLTGLTSTTWTLADNAIVTVTLAELTEALILSGQQQAALWPIPE
jgi:hypothetical protein